MRAARTLLALAGHSELAAVLRGGLVGLDAALRDAVARAAADPGTEACRDVLRELAGLLAADPLPAQAAVPATGGRRELAAGGRRELAAAFAADAQVRAQLAPRALAVFRDGADQRAEDVWRHLHLRLLRLPPPLAARWRQRAGDVVPPAPQPWRVVPAEEPVVLVPPPGTGEPGLRAGPDGELAPDVAAALAAALERPAVRAIGGVATAVLAVAELDDQLHLGLESVQFLGLRRLDAEGLRQYRSELLLRLGDLAQTPAGSLPELEALIEVDEALASLVHRPPAVATSWWAGLSATVRGVLAAAEEAARSSGADIDVQPLVLRYRDVQGMTSDNDVAVDGAGETGDVLACLRVWARLGGRVLPGRVVYRA